jgi:hypothetical protein
MLPPLLKGTAPALGTVTSNTVDRILREARPWVFPQVI